MFGKILPCLRLLQHSSRIPLQVNTLWPKSAITTQYKTYWSHAALSSSGTCSALLDAHKNVQHQQQSRKRYSAYLDCFMTQHPDDWIEPTALMEERQQVRQKQEEEEEVLHTVEGIMLHIKEPFKLHGLNVGPSECVYMTRERAHTLYTQMQTIRNLENAADSLQKASIARKYGPSQIGQEACAVGMRAAMRKHDKIIAGGQGHSWAYLMGISAFQILAELCGKHVGPSRGKGGLLNMYTENFFSGNGVPGAQVPLGGGIAFASKYAGASSTCLTMFEPHTVNKAQVFETFNMAALWKLPCIFVCQNNRPLDISEDKPKVRQRGVEYYKRGHYIPGIWLDGRDVLSVLNATTFAINYVQQHGPIILEMSTMPTPRVCDPIRHFRETCMECRLLKDGEANKIDRMVNTQVLKALSHAQMSDAVKTEELSADVYAKRLEKVRGANFFDVLHDNISMQMRN